MALEELKNKIKKQAKQCKTFDDIENLYYVITKDKNSHEVFTNFLKEFFEMPKIKE